MAVQGGTRSPMAKCDVESTPEIDDGEQKKLAALFAMCDVNGTGHLDKAAIADLLETRLSNPQDLAERAAAARSLGRPDAAETLAKSVDGLVTGALL